MSEPQKNKRKTKRPAGSAAAKEVPPKKKPRVVDDFNVDGESVHDVSDPIVQYIVPMGMQEDGSLLALTGAVARKCHALKSSELESLEADCKRPHLCKHSSLGAAVESDEAVRHARVSAKNLRGKVHRVWLPVVLHGRMVAQFTSPFVVYAVQTSMRSNRLSLEAEQMRRVFRDPLADDVDETGAVPLVLAEWRRYVFKTQAKHDEARKQGHECLNGAAIAGYSDVGVFDVLGIAPVMNTHGHRYVLAAIHDSKTKVYDGEKPMTCVSLSSHIARVSQSDDIFGGGGELDPPDDAGESVDETARCNVLRTTEPMFAMGSRAPKEKRKRIMGLFKEAKMKPITLDAAAHKWAREHATSKLAPLFLHVGAPAGFWDVAVASSLHLAEDLSPAACAVFAGSANMLNAMCAPEVLADVGYVPCFEEGLIAEGDRQAALHVVRAAERLHKVRQAYNETAAALDPRTEWSEAAAALCKRFSGPNVPVPLGAMAVLKGHEVVTAPAMLQQASALAHMARTFGDTLCVVRKATTEELVDIIRRSPDSRDVYCVTTRASDTPALVRAFENTESVVHIGGLPASLPASDLKPTLYVHRADRMSGVLLSRLLNKVSPQTYHEIVLGALAHQPSPMTGLPIVDAMWMWDPPHDGTPYDIETRVGAMVGEGRLCFMYDEVVKKAAQRPRSGALLKAHTEKLLREARDENCARKLFKKSAVAFEPSGPPSVYEFFPSFAAALSDAVPVYKLQSCTDGGQAALESVHTVVVVPSRADAPFFFSTKKGKTADAYSEKRHDLDARWWILLLDGLASGKIGRVHIACARDMFDFAELRDDIVCGRPSRLSAVAFLPRQGA